MKIKRLMLVAMSILTLAVSMPSRPLPITGPDTASMERRAVSAFSGATETPTEATETQTAYAMQIQIPRLGIDTGVEIYDGDIGDSPEVFGPDGPHFPDEAEANVCIGAHRTIKTHLFHDVHTMVKGDKVYLTYGDATYEYGVVRSFIVESTDWSFTYSTGTSTISLMACHPMGSDTQRFIVQAELVN